MPASAVSKATLVHLPRVLDLELRPLGIRGNAAAPALLDNARTRPSLPPALLAHATAPGAIADIIVYLVSKRRRAGQRCGRARLRRLTVFPLLRTPRKDDHVTHLRARNSRRGPHQVVRGSTRAPRY